MSEHAGSGWPIFFRIWSGQSISVLGSRLTSFALSVWLFKRTGSVTLFGWAVVLLTVPGVLVAPLAGALVDRWSRRRVLILTNASAALVTLAAALLVLGGRFELWHLGVILAAGSVVGSFQQPAYLTAVTLLVPKQGFGRASGLTQLSLAGARVVAPALAGVLVQTMGLPAVLLVDFATFLVALATLLGVRLPEPSPSAEAAGRPSLRQEILDGWRYIGQRPGLVWLMGFFTCDGFLMSMLEVLMLPLILSFASVAAAGIVASAVGLGMLLGSLVMSAWGGPRRRMNGILGFSLVQAATLLMAGLRPDLVLVTVAFFLYACSMPVVEGCDQVLWQNKTPSAMRGRVFASRRLAAQLVAPIGMLAAGPLADRVFEPWLAPRGALAHSAGRWIGTGAGRGVGLLIMIVGAATLALVLAAAAAPRLRRLEDELPDA
jgi:DHA3 family macrolide efflux protein-like MFS transporter